MTLNCRANKDITVSLSRVAEKAKLDGWSSPPQTADDVRFLLPDPAACFQSSAKADGSRSRSYAAVGLAGLGLGSLSAAPRAELGCP